MKSQLNPLFFETILVIDGKLPLIDHHIRRVQQTLEVLNAQLIETLETFVINITSKVKDNDLAKCRVLFFETNRIVDYKIQIVSLKEEEIFPNKPISLLFFPTPKKSSVYNKYKMYNKLLYETAIQYAENNKVPQVLIFNEANEVIETNSANLFWMQNKKIYTPYKEEGAVKGVFQTFLEEHIDINYSKISREDLLEVDEVFITNAIRGIIMVNAIENTEFPNDDSQNLQKEISNLPIFELR